MARFFLLLQVFSNEKLPARRMHLAIVGACRLMSRCTRFEDSVKTLFGISLVENSPNASIFRTFIFLRHCHPRNFFPLFSINLLAVPQDEAGEESSAAATRILQSSNNKDSGSVMTRWCAFSSLCKHKAFDGTRETRTIGKLLMAALISSIRKREQPTPTIFISPQVSSTDSIALVQSYQLLLFATNALLSSMLRDRSSKSHTK